MRETLRVLLVSSALAATLGHAESDTPSVETILDRTVNRVLLSQKQADSGAFRWKSEKTSTQYNDEGAVKEQEIEVYRAVPLEEGVFERLIERNGQPLSESEREKQDRKQQEFQEKLRQKQDSEKNEEVEFNRELVNRFVFEFEGSRDWENRPVWVLRFEPRPGDLPNERRIDAALNNSRGKLLIDQETYEIARVDFELMRPIRIWWGIIGTLNHIAGTIEREPVAGQSWLPTSVDIYFKGRILFRSLHRRIQTEYSDFESVAASVGSSGM